MTFCGLDENAGEFSSRKGHSRAIDNRTFRGWTAIRVTRLHVLRENALLLQLFCERLSYKRGKAYATMLKVIMGNGSFTVAWANLKMFQRGGRKQHKHMYSFFLVPCCWSPWTSIKQSQTFTTHNANRHCRVHFYTFVGQPLSKQLYIIILGVLGTETEDNIHTHP